MNQASHLKTNTLMKINKLITNLSQSRSKKLLKLMLEKIATSNLLRGRFLNNSHLIKSVMRLRRFRFKRNTMIKRISKRLIMFKMKVMKKYKLESMMIRRIKRLPQMSQTLKLRRPL